MPRALLAAAIAALSMSGAAQAGQCGYQYCWGAVAIGPGGAWGVAYNHISEQAAMNGAQQGCEGDCTNIRTFYNGCGALAEASDGSWGFDIGYTRAEAESNALYQCYQYGTDCMVRAWSCSH